MGSPKQLQAAPWGVAAQDNPKPTATRPGDTGLTHPGDVGLVRVVLGWHQQEQDAVEELDAEEGGDAHVEEDAKEHGQRDVLQDGLHEDGDTCGGEGEIRESCWGHPALTARGGGHLPSSPMSTATNKPLMRCSLTSKIWDFSPGAVVLVMTVRALAWVMVRTVVALSQGMPKRAASPPMATINSRSRWKPEPLTSFLSGLLTMRLVGTEGEESVVGGPLLSLSHQAPRSPPLPPRCPPGPHVVICVSRKMRMKTRRAGTTEANIIQMGKVLSFPMGLINQPRADELVTSSPLGTFSFWMGAEMGE